VDEDVLLSYNKKNRPHPSEQGVRISIRALWSVHPGTIHLLVQRS